MQDQSSRECFLSKSPADFCQIPSIQPKLEEKSPMVEGGDRRFCLLKARLGNVRGFQFGLARAHTPVTRNALARNRAHSFNLFRHAGEKSELSTQWRDEAVNKLPTHGLCENWHHQETLARFAFKVFIFWCSASQANHRMRSSHCHCHQR